MNRGDAAQANIAHVKSFAYVVRVDGPTPRLLAFASLDEPGYEVPKGSLDPGETPVQAALREVFEEAGIGGVRLVGELGVGQWQDEEQHFFLLETCALLPEAFEHVVTGLGGDAGWRYVYRWFALTPMLDKLLVQGSNQFITLLLRAYGVIEPMNACENG
jgi:putative (di)nucleoside polyphosphate hydrolase